jgi:RNA polymerase sigma-70 factor (ECF subfamily)
MMSLMTETVLSDSDFKRDLAAIIPDLRAFARSLCNNATLADDVAQEAMLKAWKARESFKAGTNLKAWCFTILRNHFYSEKRRSWRRQPLDPEIAEATLVANDDASQNIELLAVHNALAQLPDEQREALVLVGAGGMAYEEAAGVCGCAVGTIKSRVSRARKTLQALLDDPSNSYNSDENISGTDVFEELMDQVKVIASQ